MATERSEHQRWQESQIQALVELGVSILDATRQVQWVLDNLPPDADPSTHIFPAGALWQEPSSSESIHDARSNWYAAEHIPAKYKRLLDAKEETE